MKHYPTTRAPVRIVQDKPDELNRTLVHLQRSTLVLLILNGFALGFCLTAWAIAALL